MYDARGNASPTETISSLHRFPVHIMAVSSCFSSVIHILIFPQYSARYNTVISADEQGFVEYWTPTEPFELPKNVPRLWSYKTETDLYDFKKVLSPLASQPNVN